MERYRKIEADSGINFFDEVGFLRIGQDNDPRVNDIKNLADKLRKDGVEINNVDGEYLKHNFPYLR